MRFIATVTLALLLVEISAHAQTTQPSRQPDASSPAEQAAATSQPADEKPTSVPPDVQALVEKTSQYVSGEFAKPLSILLNEGRNAEAIASIHRIATESRTQLDQAAKRLSADDLTGDDIEIWQMTDRVEMLRAFVVIFEALADADETPASQKRLLETCNAIALYLDDPNAAIVESAKFWQGVVYRRINRPERTVQTLRPVLLAPLDMRIGWLARLERCTALADMNQHAAALALAAKLDARLAAWFAQEDAETRLGANESLRVVKVAILTSWADKLDKDGNTTAAANARRDAKVIRNDETWPPSSDRLLHLKQAIAGIDAWKTITPTKTPQTAAH